MAEHNKLGKEGELMAVNFLMRNGYKILAQNWTVGRLELDIVAEFEGEIVFVEVKTRRNDYFSTPRDAVTTKKIKNILRAADAYIKEHEIDLSPRFDIIEIVGVGREARLEHLIDAFISPIM